MGQSKHVDQDADGAEKDIESTPMLFDRGAIAPGADPGVVKDGDAYSVPMGYITTTDEYNPGTQPFLKVNRRGERFANEDGPYTDIIWAAQNQPGHTWCQIFDADFADDWDQFRTLGRSSLVRLRKDSFVEMVERYAEQGIIVKADTIEELAEKMGLDAQGEPIPGLYVAGDCAGSFFANNYPYLFPGVACGHCMVQGWKAVQVIAEV